MRRIQDDIGDNEDVPYYLALLDLFDAMRDYCLAHNIVVNVDIGVTMGPNKQGKYYEKYSIAVTPEGVGQDPKGIAHTDNLKNLAQEILNHYFGDDLIDEGELGGHPLPSPSPEPPPPRHYHLHKHSPPGLQNPNVSDLGLMRWSQN